MSTEITPQDVATYPPPGFTQPFSVAFSPDDRLITFLFSPEGTLTSQLYGFDPQTGVRELFVSPPQGGTTDENVSLEEALRRERERQWGFGVTNYAWAPQGNRILVPLPEGLYVQEGIHAPLTQVLPRGTHAILDPTFSPDGQWIAYVQDAEVYIVPATGGEPRQVSSGARGTGKTHGLAEYIAQEEMGRRHGYWWSTDGQQIAFAAVDETHIPVYRIVHQGKDVAGDGAQEDHRYPFAGQANAIVRLGVVSVNGGDPVWMDLGDAEYLARVQWLPDGRLSAQLENREQTQLDLVWFDPHTGERHLLLRETSNVWINLHHLFHPLQPDHARYPGGFVWGSERSGFQHLYLYDREGKLVRPLTCGQWMVDGIAGVDEAHDTIYFTATRESPLECHLYAVSFGDHVELAAHRHAAQKQGYAIRHNRRAPALFLSGSLAPAPSLSQGDHDEAAELHGDATRVELHGEPAEPRRLTQEAGMHSVVLDHGFQYFVDTHDSLHHPPVLTLRSLADGSSICTIYDQIDLRLAQLDLQPPELVMLHSRDRVQLYGALYRPAAHFGPGPHPVIVSVYGGPHAQMVVNGWRLTASMRAQYLNSLGFLVFVLDNRGSARRGLAFEGDIKGDAGHTEVNDQVDGVHWLIQQGLADPERVGIYGWSYGGYMSAMCLARAPETFKVAVAGAPVTHWDGYDTHYTERYMGLPQSNPAGYQDSSVGQHIGKITGKLLLVHGLIDENVHFRHTARLVNALIRARKPYDLMLFPDERHMPRKLEDRMFMEERIRDYFLETLEV